MRAKDITEGVGRITKQNQTVDVGPDEVTKQAAKFGNKVDKDGRPPTLSKKVKGSSTNVAFNLGMVEGKQIPNPKNTFLSKSDTAYDFIRVGKTISNLSNAKKSDNRDEPDVMIVPFGGKKEKDHLKKGLKKAGYKTQDADKPGDDAQVDENFADGKVKGKSIDEGPKDFDDMKLDAKGKQDSIDYFYRTHAPSMGKPVKAGKLGSYDIVTVTKGPTTLMFLVDANDSAVFYVAFDKYQDGVAIGNVRSNGTVKATDVYAYLVKKYGKLYSDAHQTSGGRKIWDNLSKYTKLKVTDVGDRLVATENFAKPQFDIEWEEANRYPFLDKLGKDGWIELAQTGKVANVNSNIVKKIGNTGADGSETLADLEPEKVERLKKAMKSGTIEMPIVMKMPNGKLELIAGNTRLIGLISTEGKAKVWYIDASKLEENFADGKKKGKSKPGRVKKSGASCNGSVTSLRKKAKNASGERAKMYHWCANMKSGKKK